jgi:hypothetical protein
MQRRAPRQKTQGHAVPDTKPVDGCRAMVPADGTGIRKKIKKAYEKALRDLENSRRVLDQFHQTDQPQFTRWLNSHFGALLTELRELNQKLAADDAIIFLVQNEVMFGGGSYARAYRRVMELLDNPEPPPPPPPGRERGGKRGPFDGRPEWGNSDDEEDPLTAIFDEMFGAFGPDENPRDQSGSQAGQPIETVSPPDAARRLKELYRAVVRRLYPDSQREMTAQKTEWVASGTGGLRDGGFGAVGGHSYALRHRRERHGGTHQRLAAATHYCAVEKFAARNQAADHATAGRTGLEFFQPDRSVSDGRAGATGVDGRVDGDAATVDGHPGAAHEVEGGGGPNQAAPAPAAPATEHGISVLKFGCPIWCPCCALNGAHSCRVRQTNRPTVAWQLTTNTQPRRTGDVNREGEIATANRRWLECPVRRLRLTATIERRAAKW